jgi:hypothetical protein
MKTYPSTVSRTLTPENKSLVTVIGRHDKRLTDSELNLIQDIQDLKRTKVLENTTFSGCLSASPFMFDNQKPLSLQIPAFDVLFSGNVVRVGGNLINNLGLNNVYIPRPNQWDGGSAADDAKILVVYLELWFKALESESGEGYAVSGSNKYFYPNGCIDADPSNYILDDTVDPYQGVATSARAQVQWAIRTASVPLAYNFDTFRFGLDPSPGVGEVFARGAAESLGDPSAFSFSNMGPVNGDSGLWRAGDGNIYNSLRSMDGYSYAMPLAVLFQRNTGYYSLDQNPFGSADLHAGGGTYVSGISGRVDGKFSDIVYADDLVDTRLTVSLTGYDYDKILKQSFHDIISGETNIKICRGESPGSKSTFLGSRLEYAVTFGQLSVNNTDRVGSFDGFRSGFSSDQRIYRVTETRTINQKIDGTQGAAWVLNDTVTLQLPAEVNPAASIESLVVQSLVRQTDGSLKPINLFGGQVLLTGIGSRSVIIKINQNLTGSNFDPGLNPLVITASVKYPSGLGEDLKKTLNKIQGGLLHDSTKNVDLRTFGISDYEISSLQNKQTIDSLISYNPSYSSTIFGTRAIIQIPTSQAVISGGFTTFSVPKNNIDGRYTGMYIFNIEDSGGGNIFTITSRKTTSDRMFITINGDITGMGTTQVRITVLLNNTAQISFNPSVKGLTSIEETVVVGNSTSTTDQRVRILSIRKFADRNELILVSNKSMIKGIGGNDVDRFIFVASLSEPGSFDAYKITSISLNLGILKIVVPPTVNLESQTFWIPMSLIVSLDKTSTMTLVGTYTPYQGEGIQNREYSVINAEEMAFISTNGTGSAPVVGIRDIYPYNRELPISTILPALVSWSDSDLANQSLSSDHASNYETKQASNVEHTIPTQLYTNDFIDPVASFKRRKLRLLSKSGSRGFNKTAPNVGFGIKKPKVRSVLGDSLQATVSSVTMYVDNRYGSDIRDGLTKTTAKKTISGAIKALPPVLKHPVSVVLLATGNNYALKDMVTSEYQVSLYGDNETRPQKYYTLANVSFTMQESGRLTITKESTNPNRIVIDGDQAQFGDGSVSAFVISDSRVILNGLEIKNFRTPAIVCVDSDLELLDCHMNLNQQTLAATQGSNVIINKGIITLGELASGIVVSSSNLLVSGSVKLVATSTKVDSFFNADRISNITLEKHDSQTTTSLEEGITSGTVVLKVNMNSTASCSSTWISNGKAILTTNSVLTRSILKNPFLGNSEFDSSSNVITN